MASSIGTTLGTIWYLAFFLLFTEGYRKFLLSYCALIQLYLTDTFTYVASATTASSVCLIISSLFHKGLEVFGAQMSDAMGYDAGNSVGFLNLLKVSSGRLFEPFIMAGGWTGNCAGNLIPCLDIL